MACLHIRAVTPRYNSIACIADKQQLPLMAAEQAAICISYTIACWQVHLGAQVLHTLLPAIATFLLTE